jgi:ABC-2 type transport system ATP-binding protein
MPEPAIVMERLTRRFGAVTAVDELTLEVPRGVIFGFLGPNGAGKTTTVSVLLGLLAPSEGRASVLGHDTVLESQAIRARVGVVLQHPGLYEELTVEQNLEFQGRAWRMPSTERRSRIRELLEGMGTWERRGDVVGSWSFGMQQRLALARAVLHRPQLLMLDEPTAGLDVIAANEVRATLAELPRQDATTIFLTTHNMVEAERLCDLVAVIRRGRLLALGTPQELRRGAGDQRLIVIGRRLGAGADAMQHDPRVRSVELHDHLLTLQLAPDVDLADIVRRLVGAGAEVEEARREAATLEDAFVRLVEGAA